MRVRIDGRHGGFAVAALAVAVALAGSATIARAQLIAQARVTVSGDVKSPGEYPYEDSLSVGAVLEKAGGISGVSVRSITIMRLKSGTRPPVDAGPDAILGAIVRIPAAADTPLLAGDEVDVSAYKTDFVAPGARKLVSWMSNGEFVNVTLTYFGAGRPETFEAALQKQWLAMEKQLGTFQHQIDVRLDVRGTQYAGIVSCQFSRGRGEITVIFNRDGTVSGVSMAPVAP